LDEMVDAEMREMLPVHTSSDLSKLRVADQESTSGQVLARRQVRSISIERAYNREYAAASERLESGCRSRPCSGPATGHRSTKP
jgi:hypothetical protein